MQHKWIVLYNLVFLFNPELLSVTFQLNWSTAFQTHLFELGTNSINQHVRYAVMSQPDHWISRIFLNRSIQAMIMLKESLDGRTSFSSEQSEPCKVKKNMYIWFMVCWYMILLNRKQLCIQKVYKAYCLPYELKCKAKRFLSEVAIFKPLWREKVSSMLKRWANEIGSILLGVDSF